MQLGQFGGFFGRLPVLSRDNVGGVPPRPMVLRGGWFVLAMMLLRLKQKVGQRQDVQIAESTSGQARCDLLQQPAVAVGIAERGERAVAAMLGIRTADPEPPKQVGLVRAGVHPAAVVERLADRDTAAKQLFAGGLHVGDDQVQALGGAGCRRGDVLAEDDRAPRARRRELDHAEVFTVVVVGVEPPTEPSVELLRAVEIRDGDDDYLKLHVHFRGIAPLSGSLLVALKVDILFSYVFPSIES